MNRNYKEIYFCPGDNLKECVEKLLEYKTKGEFVYGNFNGYELYSDTVTIEDAYKLITGKSEQEYNNFIEKQIEEYNFRICTNSMSDKQYQYIKMGKEILDESKWGLWEEIVAIRLKGIYQGEELKDCLDIIEILNNDTFESAKIEIYNQGHSGTNLKLLCYMIQKLSSKGEEFVKFIKQ